MDPERRRFEVGDWIFVIAMVLLVVSFVVTGVEIRWGTFREDSNESLVQPDFDSIRGTEVWVEFKDGTRYQIMVDHQAAWILRDTKWEVVTPGVYRYLNPEDWEER